MGDIKRMNFEIIRKKDMFCFETAFSTICYHYDVPYQMLFSDTWGYDYNGNNPCIGRNICINDWKLSEKIKNLGITEEKVDESYIKNSVYVRNMLKHGKIAIAIFDMPKFNEISGISYTESWSPYLIYDYEDEFVAYDLHYAHDIVTISDKLYEYACKNITFYHMKSENGKFIFKYRLEDIYIILVPNKPVFDEIEHLANILDDGAVDLEYETKDLPEGGNPVYAPLIDRIETLARGRNMFSIYLEYMNSVIPEINIDEICKKISYWAGRWNLVKVILIKAFFKKDFDQNIMKKISLIVHEIAKGEKELYEQLLEVNIYTTNKLSNKDLIFCSNLHKKEVNPVTINLSNIYNNAGIILTGSDKKADMTGLGAYIEFDKEELEKVASKYNDFYCLCDIAKKPLDNIMCQGHVIYIPTGVYNQLNILGCSDYGSFSDYLTICYEDKEEKTIIEFSSWINSQPLFNDKVYCTGQLKEINVRLYQSVGTLFTQSIELSNQQIRSIKMPDCQTIHIFSIYLS